MRPTIGQAKHQNPRMALPELGSGRHAGTVFPSEVLVADSRSLCRSALRDIIVRLAPQARIVEADCFKCTLDRLHERPIQLVCFDLDMPDLSCDTLDDLLTREGQARFLLLCDGLEPHQVQRLLKHGRVAGLIPKSASVRSIQNIVQIVLEGGRYVPPSLDAPRHQTQRQNVRLTARQRQVLEGLAAGRSTANIAMSLSVSEAMVKAHIRRACVALGARNRVMAVFIAERSGLLKVNY